MHRKAPWRSWGVMLRDGLPIGLCGRVRLDQEMHAQTWKDPEIYEIWTVNQANQNDWCNVGLTAAGGSGDRGKSQILGLV